MIKNISYNNKDIKNEINRLVGNPFPFIDRIKMGGIGSPRFTIVQSSENIQALLNRDNYINYCNIERRPNGIIVAFRSVLETYAWIVPFYQLTVYKTINHYSFYGNQEFVTLTNNHRPKTNQIFIRHILDAKARYFEENSITT